MFGLGFGELVVIFLIALIFIGPKKLPELAKGLGKGIRDFQNAAKGLGDNLTDESQTTHKAVTDTSKQQVETPAAPTATDKDSTPS